MDVGYAAASASKLLSRSCGRSRRYEAKGTKRDRYDIDKMKAGTKRDRYDIDKMGSFGLWFGAEYQVPGTKRDTGTRYEAGQVRY